MDAISKDPLAMMEAIFVLTGLLLCGFAILTYQDPAHPNPAASAAFWLLLGILFGLGSSLPHWVSGTLVLLMVCLDGSGRVGSSPPRDHAPSPLTGKVAAPILLIPACTLLVSLGYRWLDPAHLSEGALTGLALGAVLGALAARLLTGCGGVELLDEGRRLNETIGSVSLLPQLLASLGLVFASAGVGQWIASGVLRVVPGDHLPGLVLANCLVMSSLAALTGNSFAAFPIVAQGILGPLLIGPFQGDPAALGILTLAVGASGTLVSQMAANFNLVPAALLELKSPVGVIAYQWPLAAALWVLQAGAMVVLLKAPEWFR
jgi:uncharacterized membrane protein